MAVFFDLRGSASRRLELLLLALLCFLAYAPSLSIPLMEDDYPNLLEAQSYGPPAALPVLMHNAVFRLRATRYWTMWPMWRTVHTAPLAYHLVSLLLHVLNTWLVYGLAAAWPRMRPAALWAAAFFAVAEGHQEAVMWFSAINELYLFLFGASSLLCWMLAWRPGGSRWLLAASPVLFALALLSKESAVVLLPLFLLAAPFAGWNGLRRSLLRLAPHMVLAALAVTSVAASRGVSFRFSDGSFSLHAPFWMTWPRGMARILWIWGWLALGAIAWFRKPELRKSAYLALAWIGIALAPYSFLTYSAQIPSRQTYLASFGLALLAGLALGHLVGLGPSGRRAAIAVALVMLLSNAGYLWTRKRAQFLARAEPTEQLIKLARQTEGPIWIQCFPRAPYIAQEAVHLGAGRSPSILIWTQSEAARRRPTAVFCYHER